MSHNCTWLQECFQNQNIPNYSIEDSIAIFGKSKINLPDYILAITGKRNDVKTIAFIQIIHCANPEKPLHGSHSIWLYEYSQMTEKKIEMSVYSLSYLRHGILKFSDRLSFERSAFVIIPDKKCMVRLKCIRSILTCYSSFDSIPIYVEPVQIIQVSERTKSQFINNLQQLFTSYIRDLNVHYSREIILDCFQIDLANYVEKLKEFV